MRRKERLTAAGGCADLSRTSGESANRTDAASDPVGYAVTRRARCARTFSRLPQIAMLHQRADWFFDRS